MDASTVTTLLFSLVIGLAVGAVITWLLVRARADSAGARHDAELERSRAELAQAQSQAADARAQAADARSETSQVRSEAARLQTDLARRETSVAEARGAVAEAQAEAAEVSARLAAATAERDAALERATQLSADREALVREFKVLSTETLDRQGKAVDATTAQRLEQTREALVPLTNLMTAFADRLTSIEKERVAMATDLRNQVQAVQSTGEHLRRETHALATALRKPQVRGHWGEVQLRRVAEYAGMVDRCDFELQATERTSADKTIRPDMRVNLTDGKYLFVDAKVPLSAFLDAHETDDERTRSEKLELFGRNVKSHVDQLSGKEYWKVDAGTPEFVVLFLPNEQFLFAASEIVPDLHEYAARRDIVLATPTTLIALLRAVAYGWKQAALAESAAEVFHLGRELYDRIGTMGSYVDKTGRSLTAAIKAYNQMIGSLETRVLPAARRLQELQVNDRELASPQPVDETTRSITARELVEDATRVEPLIGRSRRHEVDAGPAPAPGAAGAGVPGDLPERAELVRGEPDLLEWAEQTSSGIRRRSQGA